MQKAKNKIWFLMMIAFFFETASIQAQRPPTGGPNPPPIDQRGLNPLIYPAIGIAVGAATYLLVKKRPVRLPTVVHLQTHLLQQGILPSPDALKLMYALNPKLQNTANIKSSRKLKNPEFPIFPVSQLNILRGDLQNPVSFLPQLQEQIKAFEASLASFNRTKTANKNSNLNAPEVTKELQQIETDIKAIKGKAESLNAVQGQLLMDLIRVTNQTLSRNSKVKSLNEKDPLLYKGIAEDLAEILQPIEQAKNSFKSLQFSPFQIIPNNEYNLLAQGTPDDNQVYNVNQAGQQNLRVYGNQGWNSFENTSSKPQNSKLKSFAFAVYKINSNGEPTTVGHEVEGQYYIQYVLPALKDFKESYHNLSPPLATYASANLPPGKYFLMVKDLQGNPIQLQNPLINTRDAFLNPQREYVDDGKEIIKITIHVP